MEYNLDTFTPQFNERQSQYFCQCCCYTHQQFSHPTAPISRSAIGLLTHAVASLVPTLEGGMQSTEDEASSRPTQKPRWYPEKLGIAIPFRNGTSRKKCQSQLPAPTTTAWAEPYATAIGNPKVSRQQVQVQVLYKCVASRDAMSKKSFDFGALNLAPLYFDKTQNKARTPVQQRQSARNACSNR